VTLLVDRNFEKGGIWTEIISADGIYSNGG